TEIPHCERHGVGVTGIGLRRIDGVRHETTLTNPAWDEFLQQTDLGQFQQSTCWAKAKAAEWRCERIMLQDESGITGGFQWLWRPTRFGRFGYVPKGPVPRCDASDAWAQLVPLIQQSAVRLDLAALIVQPPDFSCEAIAGLRQCGFEANALY